MDNDTSIADDASSVTPPKYTWGQHPASLANLKPPWKPGQSGAGTHTGPMVTPAMRRLAELGPRVIGELLASGELNTAEVIAAKTLLAAIEGIDRGVKARDQVLNRLDGEPEKSTPAIAVQVNLTWNDGDQA